MECENCTRKKCTEACFEAHPGSEIAFRKMFPDKNIHFIKM
jgi:hypothetical protein